jgi:hypothetical protein|nr:hypothetical protein [Neorhizobium tomejilense]
MLDQALRVVEAARRLKLERKGKTSASALTDRVTLALAIDGLREAIEDFDRETAQGLSSPSHQPRPDFATPPQLNEEGFVEKQELIDTRAATPGMVPEPDLAPEPDFMEDRPEFTAGSSRTFAPGVSIPAASMVAGMDYINTTDLGDFEFNDGGESVADFLESLDAISDKLQYAVAKVGWSPRLRALAEAANIARSKMFLEVSHDGYFIRVPAQNWSTMTVALADAVMDRDNNFKIPVPIPKPAPALETAYAPRPPGYGY